MARCRGPANRLIMFRKKGLSGPFAQNVGGGMCVKTMGNAYDVGGALAGLKPLNGYTGPATGCGTEPPGLVLYQPQAADWVGQGSNVLLNEENGVSIENVNVDTGSAFGAQLNFDTFAGFEPLEIGKTYNISCDLRVDPGDNVQIGFLDTGARIWRTNTNDVYETETWAAQTIQTATQNILLNFLSTGEKMYIRNWVIEEV